MLTVKRDWALYRQMGICIHCPMWGICDKWNHWILRHLTSSVKTETMARGAQSPICGNQWLPPQSSNQQRMEEPQIAVSPSLRLISMAYWCIRGYTPVAVNTSLPNDSIQVTLIRLITLSQTNEASFSGEQDRGHVVLVLWTEMHGGWEKGQLFCW